MIYVGADSFKWQSGKVVKYNTKWNDHPLSGVAVRFGCFDLITGLHNIDRTTRSNGIATISEKDAKSVGCDITNMSAYLTKLNVSDNIPNRGQPTYDYFFPVLSAHNVAFLVPAQSSKEDPKVRKIGIRPTVQGEVLRENNEPVSGRDVCLMYRDANPKNMSFCDDPPAEGIAIVDTTDDNGRYMLRPSYGDSAINRSNGYHGDTTWIQTGDIWKSKPFTTNGTPILYTQGPVNTRNAKITCPLASQIYDKANSMVGYIGDKIPDGDSRGPCDTFVRRDVLLQVLGAAKLKSYGIGQPAGGAAALRDELEDLVAQGIAQHIPLNKAEKGDIFYTVSADENVSTGHVGFMIAPDYVINAVTTPENHHHYIVKRRPKYTPSVIYRLCD